MKLAAVADVHIGNHRRFGGVTRGSINERCEQTLQVFDQALQNAVEWGAKEFIVAGDLFDYSRPEAPIIRRVQDSIKSAVDQGMGVTILLGNHDQVSLDEQDHALGPLAHVGASIVAKPERVSMDDVNVLLVPFQPGPVAEWLPDVVAGIAGGSGERVLVVHMGIRDDKTAPWMRDAADAVHIDLLAKLCLEKGISTVIAGNWHDRRTWVLKKDKLVPFTLVQDRPDVKRPKLEVFQLGALVPTGWDNAGLEGYGTLGLIDTEFSIEMMELPGPRFVKCTTLEQAQKTIKLAQGMKLYVSMTVPPEDLTTTGAWLQDAQAKGEVVNAEAVPDEAVARSEARSAAEAAQSAASLDQALEAYVSAMPMPENVSRDRVLERTKEYL